MTNLSAMPITCASVAASSPSPTARVRAMPMMPPPSVNTLAPSQATTDTQRVRAGGNTLPADQRSHDTQHVSVGGNTLAPSQATPDTQRVDAGGNTLPADQGSHDTQHVSVGGNTLVHTHPPNELAMPRGRTGGGWG